MARRRRVPYKPDKFQVHGRRAADWVLSKSGVLALCLVLVVGLFIAVAVVLTGREKREDEAWTAYYEAAGDVEKLTAAVETYRSGSARPYLLLSLASASVRRPVDEEGQPKEESAAQREERLHRAEAALRELTEDYPEHYMRLYGLALLGLVLEEEGRHREAVAVLLEALEEEEPGTLEPKLRCDIGRNYVLAGDPEAARPHLEIAAEATGTVFLPSVYRGGQQREVPAVWKENAEYLLSRIGRRERAIPVPKPGERPEPRKGEEREKTEQPGEQQEEEREEPGHEETEAGEPAAAEPGAAVQEDVGDAPAQDDGGAPAQAD
jgi:tetratricopeptide (TPR) repeat protein